MTPLHYNLEDFIYVIRGDGNRSKRYKHWCASCQKDRGYAYKNKIIKEYLCHGCKMKQPDVLSKISLNSQKLKHSEKSKAKTSASLYKRYGSNPLNRKLAINLRGRLSQAVRNNYKSGSAVKDLGCSINDLKIRLESMFYPHPDTGEMMSWNNYGKFGWHIDHIKPLCKFDLTDEVQLKEACCYINLQPLWRKDNLEKRHVDGTFGSK